MATIKSMIASMLAASRLPAEAKSQRSRDRRGLPTIDPGIDATVEATLGWICDAQDNSCTRDGGIARDYSLINGWNSSYPETTGYIVPTLLDAADRLGRKDLPERAKRMIDWLVSIQMDDGAFQGGVIDAEPVAPVAFNTGQILMGLSAGASRLADEASRTAAIRAADWLVSQQDEDGAWRKGGSPFASPGPKAYDAHIAWGLVEAFRAALGEQYLQAARKNIDWVVGRQRPSGWFEQCCLTNARKPLTHTLGYTLRGILETYRETKDDRFLTAACKAADGMAGAIDDEGFLPGRLYEDWRPAVNWACLTGSVQIAACWLILYRHTGDKRYRDAGFAANRYVRRTVDLIGPASVVGAVKGSFPVDGGYCTFSFPNWAAKFFIDANVLEQSIRTGGEAAQPGREVDTGEMA